MTADQFRPHLSPMRCPNCGEHTGYPDSAARRTRLWSNQHGRCWRVRCDRCGQITDLMIDGYSYLIDTERSHVVVPGCEIYRPEREPNTSIHAIERTHEELQTAADNQEQIIHKLIDLGYSEDDMAPYEARLTRLSQACQHLAEIILDEVPR